MTSLSGLAGILIVAVGLSAVHAWFEFILPLPMAAIVAVSGEAILVSTWAAREVPTRSGKASHPALLMMTRCVNFGSSG